MSVGPACRLGRRAAISSLLALLAACAQWPGPAPAPPPPPPRLGNDQNFLSGRLGLQVEGLPERSFSADFELRGSAQAGELLISGPFGATAARAQWAPGMARLDGPQGEVVAADLSTLAERALGAALPIGALFDWLNGRPWPEAPASALPDGASGFDQLGWRINLARWAERRVEVMRLAPPVVTVRLRLNDG